MSDKYTEEDYERCAREHGWVSRADALAAPECPLFAYLSVTRSELAAELRECLEGGAISFINPLLHQVSAQPDWTSLAGSYGIEPFEVELAVPTCLPAPVRILTLDIRQWLRTRGDAHTGGCRAFWAPAEFRAHERTPVNERVVLVIMHDGGGLASYCNPAYEQYDDCHALEEFLSVRGYWIEQQSSWYSYIFEK